MKKPFIFFAIILLAAVVVVSGCVGQTSTIITNNSCEGVKCPNVFWNGISCECPPIEPTCNTYFWYDDDTKFLESQACTSKEFCGAFMYQGLRTFETKEECFKSLNEIVQAKTVIADIKNFAFSQNTITINKGDTVVWTNEDTAPHTVTSSTGSELTSKTLSKGDSYTHTFNTVGTFSYFCTFHPGMKASVVVE